MASIDMQLDSEILTVTDNTEYGNTDTVLVPVFPLSVRCIVRSSLCDFEASFRL